MENKLERIITIGPVHPYRGGIAQYGSLLIQELEQRYDVESISYSVMYPKFIYPGKEQKDYSIENPIKSNINYIINTVNPLSYIKTARYINRYNPDLIILHWWQPFFAPAYISILKLVKKNINVCICCNNVLPHDNIPGSKMATRFVLKCGDMFIVHSKQEEQILLDLLNKDVHHIQIPCPNVSTFEKKGISKTEGRQLLKLKEDDEIIMFFGFVRKYKGLHHLINIMPQLIQHRPKIKLLIVGDFYENKDQYLETIKENKLEDYIKIYDEFIPDSEVEPYFVSADVVVLPYESATTSGVIQAAYNFVRPVIVTNVGGLKEAVIEGKTGYVVEPDNDAALRSCIENFFESKGETDYVQYIEAEMYKYSWHRVVDLIQEMWESYTPKK